MINNDMWEKVESKEFENEEIKRPSLTYWADAFRRLLRNKLAIVSLIFLGLLILMVIFLPMFWSRSYSDQQLGYSNIPPTLEIYKVADNEFIYVTNDFKVIEVTANGKLLSAPTPTIDDMLSRSRTYVLNGYTIFVNYRVQIDDPTSKVKFNVFVNGSTTMLTQYKTVKNASYLLGTDKLGRDYFLRLIYGGRISLAIGFAAALVNFIIGVVYGGVAGYFGGKIDNIMMRIVDTISTIPLILYVIVLMVVLPPSLGTIILALTLTYWVGMARIVRGSVLALKEQEFVLAAKTIGANSTRIIFRHILPNTMGPVMVALTMQIPTAIFTEAFLSFIGLGVSEPIPSWGSLANDGLAAMSTSPYLLFYPALIMSVTLLAFNLLGDGLRDALDPRLRK